MKKVVYLLAPLMCLSTLVGCNTEPNKYTVTWKNYDGTVLETDEDVIEGSTPEYNGELPIRPGWLDDFHIYEFKDFGEIKPVHSDQEYIAEFTGKVDDSITEIDVIPPVDERYKTYSLKIAPVENKKAIIDWGDGNKEETLEEIAYIHEYIEKEKNYTVLIKNAASIAGETNDWNDYHAQSIKLGNSITKIDDNAFKQYSCLKNIYVPETVTYIGESAFATCTSLEGIIIPENVTTIMDSTFISCKCLTSVKLSNYIESIGVCSFMSCHKLSSIVMPSSIKSVGSSAFTSCSSLKLVDFSNVEIPPVLSFKPFGVSSGFKILVPKGKKDIYRNAASWSDYYDYIDDE